MRTQHTGEIAAAGLTFSREDYGHLAGRAKPTHPPCLCRASPIGWPHHGEPWTLPRRASHIDDQSHGIYRRLELASIWRREFHRVRSELACYSERQLNADLRMSRSDIPYIAMEAANERVAARVQHGFRHGQAAAVAQGPWDLRRLALRPTRAGVPRDASSACRRRHH